jgi:pimeloyl-ACP methyl ester carboxylesterase
MKRLLRLILLLIVITLTNSLSAQNPKHKNMLPGAWLGKISTNGIDLRLVFNLSLNDKDSLIASADSPDQGVKNIPMGRVILRADTLTIEAPMIAGKYTGTVTSDSSIYGTWTQGGATFTVDLKRLKAPIVLNRPQEPKPPFPYTSEEVTFTNSKFDIKLAGTLTIPEGPGPFKTVVMISGSGAQNRNEELLGHKPFLIIADHLSRNGIAVLRYDDRGVGASQGIYSEATSADLATDGEAAVAFLRNNPKISQNAIGLMGHSEGGLIAPIIYATDPGVGFIVSLAGPGVTGEKIILRQSADISRASGVDEKTIKESVETNKKLFAILKKEKDNKTAERKILTKYAEILEKQNTPEEDAEKAISNLGLSFGAGTYTWLRYFLVTDPAVYWKKVKCPVLALNGEKDLQVASDENLQAIKKALKSSESQVKTVSFPDLNHLFQHCKTGLPAEYSTIEETFSPEALKIITDWILAL